MPEENNPALVILGATTLIGVALLLYQATRYGPEVAAGTYHD